MNWNPLWNFDHSYARLPEAFFVRVAPVPVAQPECWVMNQPLAHSLGLDPEALQEEPGLRMLAGNWQAPGTQPLAQAYAGHQFGHFTFLGDGRAHLLGEHCTPDGRRLDVQLKGSGPTPYSRRGDGRAALGPMLREYLISEAMHGLGIPTTRSLAVLGTGEDVYRERLLPGAILTRIAQSHLRVGTFEFAAALDAGMVPASHPSQRVLNESAASPPVIASGKAGDADRARAKGDAKNPAAPADCLYTTRLADYTLARHYPELAARPTPERYLAFLEAVIERQAWLIAEWMRVGFLHGVMNTDNMTLSGETIDYGPCAFLDTYAPATVFSSIDRQGRYAFGQQAPIAQWNLARFAETLLPLLDPHPETALRLATQAIEGFVDRFTWHWHDRLRAKLGLWEPDAGNTGDAAFLTFLLDWLNSTSADYTNSFRELYRYARIVLAPAVAAASLPPSAPPSDLFPQLADWHQHPAFQGWFSHWQARWLQEGQRHDSARTLERMRLANPAVIPRNHRVEEALTAAVEDRNLQRFHDCLRILADPYADALERSPFTAPGTPEHQRSYRTFCGT